jgi:uncharacterized protein (DUF305 family)
MYGQATLSQLCNGIVLRTATATITVALGLGATACSGPEKAPDTRPTAGGTAPVIVPGGPGEPARTARPGERVGPSTVPAGPADLTFAQRMIPHHQQAIEMATLAKDRASGTEVRGLAGRIVAAQNPEIAVLRSWLKTNGGAPLGGHGGAGHAGMPGMATPTQLADLRAAGGEDFDQRFLGLMITHHEGALRMAGEELTAGRDPFLLRMAKDVHATQTAEIRRMRTMQDN